MPNAAPTILVVEDEPALRDLAIDALEPQGYAVVTAASGEAAMEILAEREADLLLTDVMMPGMSGFVLARRAKQLRPALKIIYMTGYAETAAGWDEDRHGPLLRKPFRIDQLLGAVKRALAGDG